MKILLIGNYLPDHQQSMQRYAALLLSEFAAVGHDVKLLCPPVVLGRYRWPSSLMKWVGYIDKFVLFPHSLRRAAAWADVVHICDHSNAMYHRHILAKPHVVTCHDLLAVRSARGDYPLNPVGWSGKILQKWIAGSLQTAKFVVCDSMATLKDCRQVLGMASEKLQLVHLGLNYPYRPLPTEHVTALWQQRGLVMDRPYLLHVGSNSWYKNRATIIDIFFNLVQKRDMDLVFAGTDLTAAMNQRVADKGLTSRVKQLGSVTNEELAALYSGAAGLIFPSLIEGYGWPVLEAQACGCPVFTSNRAPMTEIGGDAAVYFDPLQPVQAAATIHRHLDDTTDMRARGFINSAGFTNTAMRDGYLAIYSRLVHHS